MEEVAKRCGNGTNLTNNSFLSRFSVEKDVGFTCRYIKAPDKSEVRAPSVFKLNLITFHFSFRTNENKVPEWWISLPETGSGAIKINHIPADTSRILDGRLWIPCTDAQPRMNSLDGLNGFIKHEYNLSTFYGFVLEPLSARSSPLTDLCALVDRLNVELKMKFPTVQFPADSSSCPIYADPHPRANTELLRYFKDKLLISKDQELQKKSNQQLEFMNQKYKQATTLIEMTRRSTIVQWFKVREVLDKTFETHSKTLSSVDQEVNDFIKKMDIIKAIVKDTIENGKSKMSEQDSMLQQTYSTITSAKADIRCFTSSTFQSMSDKEAEINKARNKLSLMLEVFEQKRINAAAALTETKDPKGDNQEKGIENIPSKEIPSDDDGDITDAVIVDAPESSDEDGFIEVEQEEFAQGQAEDADWTPEELAEHSATPETAHGHETAASQVYEDPDDYPEDWERSPVPCYWAEKGYDTEDYDDDDY